MSAFLKKYKDLFLIIVFGTISFGIIFFLVKKEKIERNNIYKTGVFSLAEITDFRKETRSHYFKYTFHYNNKIYKSNIGVKKGLEVGQKYFLIINPEKPKNYNFLLYRYPVPDSITSAPPEGWKELPIPVDKEEIRKFLENY